MNDKLRSGYRKRLSEGDVVFFVEGETMLGQGQLTVKKGLVSSTSLPLGHDRRYLTVTIQDDLDAESMLGVAVTKSPRELFTTEEVARVLQNDVGPLSSDQRRVEDIIRDEIALHDLTSILGGAAMSRLVEDEIRNPGDPEY